VLPSVIQRWVGPGELRIEYHALQTATREPEVFVAQQVAALAAGKQDRAWQFIETFYEQQGEEGSGYVTDAYLEGIVSQLSGLNLAQWTADRTTQTSQRSCTRSRRERSRSGRARPARGGLCGYAPLACALESFGADPPPIRARRRCTVA
jgi:hypothetical protein